MDHSSITERDLIQAAKQFQTVYPLLLEELDRIEAIRGELNDFQLMLAVSRAKDAVGIINWERRKLVNDIFESYMDVCRSKGRAEADMWVADNFGGDPEKLNPELPPQPNPETRIEVLARQIMERESELLQLYREYHKLQGWPFPVREMEK
ncbi:hypothetical protein [Paenibacillus koleovorans]|uniref:hypothetical protein n=1 Tax=Paenibacillus koleovorans TaxID=121608 RepID=UPI000FDCB324|nr:hypothetical protein [Paenibacillus koleovorans]